MDYETFAQKFMDELELNLPEGVELKRQEIHKVNGINLDGLAVKSPDSPIAPTIYINDAYDMYSKGGLTVSECVMRIIKSIEKSRDAVPEIPNFTYEEARKKLYGVLVNYKNNTEMLENVPHERIEDLAFIARYRVGEDGSVLLTNELCTTMQLTDQEALEIAHANTEKQEYSCTPLSSMLKGLMQDQGLPDDYIDEVFAEEEVECPMYILTNKTRYDGASALASDKALKDAWDKIGDYHIIASSRHELILVPESFSKDIEALKAMHSEVQDTTLSEIDKLSDAIYRYDGRSLSRADAPVESLKESPIESLTETITATITNPKAPIHARAH